MSGVEAGAITWGELGFGRGRGIVRRPSIPRSFPAALPETQVILGGSQTAVDVGSLIEEGEILSNGGILYSWGIELPNGGIIVAKAPSEINAKRRTLEDIFGPDGDLLSQAVLAPFVSSKSPLVWAGVGISAGYDAVKASIASLSLGREVNLEEAEGMSLAQVSPTLDRALRITLAASLIAGDVTGGPSGIKQIIEGYPQPSDDNPSTPDGGSGNHNDGQGPLAKIINRAATIITGLPLILTRKDSQQDEVTPGCTGAFPTQTPSLEAGQDLPQPGVTVFTNPTNTPQQELAKDTPTPETVIGSVDTAFWAIPGAPEGFGGTGEYIPFKNNSTIQDNLNKNGFAPIIDATGNLSQTQVQDGLRVCIANLPEKLVSRTSPTGEEVKINSKAGIVNFGDSISNNILTKAINVVSLNELPEGWSCVNAVVIDENNPAGLGALRMLLVDSNGKIQGETPAAFSGNDNVEIRWGGNGPALYVNGELKQFSLSEEVQAAPLETEEVVILPTGVESVEHLKEWDIGLDKDNQPIAVFLKGEGSDWISVPQDKLSQLPPWSQPRLDVSEDGTLRYVDANGKPLYALQGEKWIEEKELYYECGKGRERVGYEDTDPRGPDGEFLPSGIQGVEHYFLGHKYFTAGGCILEPMTLVPEERFGVPNIYQTILGFWDTDGNLHRIPAIYGGGMANLGLKSEKSMSLLCVGNNCRFISVDEAVTQINSLFDSPKSNFQIIADIIRTQNPSDLPKWLTDYMQKYTDLNLALKQAIETGKGFPDIPQDYNIYIFQLYINP